GDAGRFGSAKSISSSNVIRVNVPTMNPQPVPPAPSPPCYTAALIAAALGLSKRAILHRLRATLATRAIIVQGQAADAWDMSALPVGLQEQLQSAAHRRGYRNAEQLLAGQQIWTPKIPLSRVSENHRQKAEWLKRAMIPAF